MNADLEACGVAVGDPRRTCVGHDLMITLW